MAAAPRKSRKYRGPRGLRRHPLPLIIGAGVVLVLAILLVRHFQDSISRPGLPAVEEWLPGLVREAMVGAGVTPGTIVPTRISPDTWRMTVEPSFPLEDFSASLSKAVETSSLVGAVRAPAGWSDDAARITFTPKAPDAATVTLTVTRARRPPPEPPGPPSLQVPPSSRSTRPARPRVAIVIDDLGINRELSLRAVGLAGPVTVAVIPLLPLSTEIARAAAGKKEILIHVPMEPKNPEKNPGPGVLTQTMARDDIVRVLRDELASVPGAVGINNHMGSLLTTDARAMDDILAWVSAENLLFLDSMTDPESIGTSRARRIGLRPLRRDVFLDNVDEPEAIRKQFEELLDFARRHGSAIGIAHPRANTLAILESELPRLTGQGIELVPVSRMVR